LKKRVPRVKKYRQSGVDTAVFHVPEGRA